MKKEVVIIGAGGHAKVIGDIIKKSGDIIIGFLDDNLEIQGNVVFDNKHVIGTTSVDYIEKYKDKYFIIAIGSNRVRKIISEKYPDLKWYTAIHPNATIANEVEIGEGSAIMAGTIINSGTKIGKHCIINTCSSLDHDNIIKDYVHISPGAHLAGTVNVGERTWVCTGVTIINNITIGENNIIGAGSTVLHNILETDRTIVGTPAERIIK